MNIKELLNNKIKELENETFADEEEQIFFEDFNKKLSRKDELEKISNTDFFKAVALLQKVDTYENLCKIFDELKELNEFNRTFNENLVLFLTVIHSLKKVNLIEKLIKLDKMPEKDIIDNIIKSYNEEKDGVIEGKRNPKVEVTACLIGYKKIGLSIFNSFEHLQMFARIMSKCDNVDVVFPKFINYKNHYKSYRYLKKNVNKLDSEEIEMMNDILEEIDIENILQKVSEHDFELTKRKVQFNKNKHKKVNCYKSMLDIIESFNDGKIVNLKDDIFNKLDDSEISNEFIKAVLEHNRKVYLVLEIENIKRDNYNQIERIFLEKNISLEQLSFDDRNILLQKGNINELKEILEYLGKEEFNWLNSTHPNYIQIVLNTTPQILKRIHSLIKLNIISIEMVKEKPNILLDNIQVSINDNDLVPAYSLFNNNIELLRHEINDISSKNIKRQKLLCENLKEKINLCKKYELNFNSDSTKTYDFSILYNDKYFDYLDSFIELGYAEYIKNNIHLLNSNSDDILTRLSIVTNIGILTKDKVNNSIISGKKFYVANSDLPEYKLLTVDKYMYNDYFNILNNNSRIIISEKTENLSIINYLDNLFKVNELEYQINDIIISRNKVLRNIECIIKNKQEYDEAEIIFSAITYNSIIDNKTIEIIEEILKDYQNNVSKKKTYNI